MLLLRRTRGSGPGPRFTRPRCAVGRLAACAVWIASSAVVPSATLTACAVHHTPNHPAVRGAPAASDDTDAARLVAVKRAAAKDLSCPEVEVVLTFNRDYANVDEPSRVVDGCGKRAVYAEACSEYPPCRYLLLSILVLPDGAAERPTPTPP